MASVSDHKTTSSLVQELADGLRQAGRDLASSGKPELAAAYLRQALPLLPGEAARQALADLARLESIYDLRSAIEHFGTLVAETGDLEMLAEAASSLVALTPSVRDERTWCLARDAIAACEDPLLRLRLRARIGLSAVLTLDAGEWCEQLLPELRGYGSVTAGEKAALGVIAFSDLWCGRPLTEVQRGAEALFRDDWVALLPGNGHCFWAGMAALVISDSPLTPQATGEALAYARRQAASGYEGGTLVLHAHARLRAGDLAGAVADGRRAFEIFKAYGGGPVPLAHALATVAEAERQRGNLEAARRTLAQAPPDSEAGTLGLAGTRLSRARLRAAAGAPAVALDELMRIGADYEALGGNSPALLPWRSEAALLAKQLGREAQALVLADAELEAAAQAGPRALGRALATRAAVGPQPDALWLATEAVAQLELVQAPLELADALRVRGLARAAAGAGAPARDEFTRALELAERAGARPLARTIREALVRVGGRPRRGASVGVQGLTPAEQAVAAEAARGLSNREIAEALHLAPGTVKNQLAAAYRKLAVSSRGQLSDVFDND